MRRVGVEDQRPDGAGGEIDIRGLAQVLAARRKLIAGCALAAFVSSAVFVTMVRPRYTSEAKLLVENQESYIVRSDRTGGDTAAPDAEAVTSQVQVITSRDLARTAIERLQLRGNPEFDPAATGPSIAGLIGSLLGGRREGAGDERIMDAYFERLAVSQVAKSRVLQIEFRSNNPDLSARAANTVADLYIEVQADAKRKAARTAAATLGALVSELRTKVAQAETTAEEFRASHGIVLGANNLSMTSQQLTDLNNQVTLARTSQADAQAKAQLLRDMIKQGRLADVSDVANNDLVKRIAEQRVALRAQLAAESRTLLSEHPRIKELNAQLAGLEGDLRAAAEKAARTLENDARVAGARVENLQAVLEEQRKSLGGSSVDEARARELDRDARLLKDQLEASLARYQEALARQNAESTPGDARVISRAVPPQDPSFPKKLPIMIFATVAGLVLSSGGVVVALLLSGGGILGGRASRVDEPAPREPATIEPVAISRDPKPVADPAQDSFPSDQAIAKVSPLPGAVSGLLGRIAGGASAGRALRILVTSGSDGDQTVSTALVIGRALSQERPAILVDLARNDGGPGVHELLSGSATFNQAIHLDGDSRLHVLNAGAERLRPGQGLDVVLEALAQTYGYVILSAPPIAGDLSLALAPRADFTVLTCSSQASDPAVSGAFQSLRGAGAKEILAIAVDVNPHRPERHVA